MSLLPPGTSVPPFSAVSSDGHIYSERELKGRRILLAFIRRIGHRRGQRQLAELQRGTARLRAAGVEILGVAAEPPAALGQFANAAGCEFPLLSDEQHQIATAFGVPSRLGEPSSAWFLIGEQGEVIFSAAQPVKVDEIYATVINLAATHARR